MIKLKNHLNYKGLLHETGTVVSVPAELEDKMVKAGTAERYIPKKKEEPAKEQTQLNNETLDGLIALKGILTTSSKRVMLTYAEHAGVKDIHDRIKNEDIVNAIVEDAKEKGIDLEGMTDDQLVQFAGLCGIEAVKDGLPREEMLNVIKKYFGERFEPPNGDGK